MEGSTYSIECTFIAGNNADLCLVVLVAVLGPIGGPVDQRRIIDKNNIINVTLRDIRDYNRLRIRSLDHEVVIDKPLDLESIGSCALTVTGITAIYLCYQKKMMVS